MSEAESFIQFLDDAALRFPRALDTLIEQHERRLRILRTIRQAMTPAAEPAPQTIPLPRPKRSRAVLPLPATVPVHAGCNGKPGTEADAARKEVAQLLYRSGHMPVAVIAKFTGMSAEEVERIVDHHWFDRDDANREVALTTAAYTEYLRAGEGEQ